MRISGARIASGPRGAALTIRALAFCFLAVLLARAPVAAQDGPVVTTSAGALRGGPSPHGVGAIFRGVPYAQPPVGPLRWRPPQTPAPWSGVRDATVSGPPCLQRPFGWNDADAGKSREDCLYLDVSTPKLDPAARLPVMVLIHGGANWAGYGSGYATSSIVRQGVVLVTVNYRLDVFGFLSLPALTTESPRHSSGNYALMDQIAALRWVRANIARFGGDPGNVTIFGQSAGAQDVGLLTLSPEARGLFARVIEESGTAGFGLPPRTLAQNEAVGDELRIKLNAGPGSKGLQALRGIPGPEVLKAATGLTSPTLPDQGFIWVQPVVDGWVVPDTPLALLQSPRKPRTPLILGTIAREMPLYRGREHVAEAVREMFGSNAEAALRLYTAPPAPDEAVMGDASERLAADLMFRCPADLVASLREAHGAPVWQYQLSVTNPSRPLEHGSDLAFVFDTPPAGSSQAAWPPLQLYWTNFAKTGDPNGPGLPRWPRYDGTAAYLDFTQAGAVAKAGLRKPFCDLLHRP